jgi:uncharacterized oligopeptide transporter (OPT) family protein
MVPLPLDRVTRQLTLRALLTGMIMGAVLSICNVYTGLKIGWGTNMSITGILVAYALWAGIRSLSGGRVRQFTILENNINQASCSAAAAVSSAGLVAPIPALTLITGEKFSWIMLAPWVFAVCLVGITVATGLRRQMIIVDKLPFPSGIACAATLKEIYGHGSEAIKRVAMMGVAAVAAGAIKVLSILKITPTLWPLSLGPLGSLKIAGEPAARYTLGIEPSLLMVGVGGLIGFRAGASLLLGAILAWGVIAPRLVESGAARLRANETLAALPAGVTFEPRDRMEYQSARKQLIFGGRMSEEQFERFAAKSDDLNYREALAKLRLESNHRFVSDLPVPSYLTTTRALPNDVAITIPAALANRVRLVNNGDAVQVTGVLTAEECDMLAAGQAESAVPVVNSLYAGSQFTPPGPNFTDLVEWLLWPGVTLMVVSSLVAFSFSWRSMMRSFRGGGSGEIRSTEDTGEVSRQWFIFGLAVALVFAVTLQMVFFDIAIYAAVLGVLLSFVLAVVASRVSGETNTTPVGAMGKVTQLVFGVLVPSSPAANLMTANITGGAASQCADLMHDFKCGHLLGATARYQAVGQIGGAFAGALLGSLFYLILIPDPHTMLLTPEWPAPAVATWKAVADLFAIGIDALPPGTPIAIAIAAMLGVILPVLDRFSPKGVKPWIPSASALGLAFVINGYNSVSMFIGATIALIVAKAFPRWSDRFLVTICAGIVAGESLTGAGDAVRLVLMGRPWAN